MPGLMTLRPLASAAAKAAKGGAKNAVSAAGPRGEREESRRGVHGQREGAVTASPTFARVARVQTLQRAAAHRHQQQQECLPAPAPQAQLQEQQPKSNHDNLRSSSAVPPQQLQQRANQRGQPPSSTQDGQQLRGNAHLNDDEMRRNGLAIGVARRMAIAADYGSSGSEHEPNSVCLAEMVYDYIEEEESEPVTKCGRARCNCDNTSCCGESDCLRADGADGSSLGGELVDTLQGLVSSLSPFEKNVLDLVTATMKELEDESDQDSHRQDESLLQESHYSSSSGTDLLEKEDSQQLATCKNPSKRRLIMSALRSIGGLDAAICKSRWEHGGGFPAGEYEYIDVIMGNSSFGLLNRSSSDRIIVDIDFKTQFEIARQTSQYSALLQSLPAVFVGNAARLHQIVSIMCDASKRCLKKTGMHLPPWRKPDYIRAKWFSSYRRTTNPEASLSAASHPFPGSQIGKNLPMRGAPVLTCKFANDDMENSFQKHAGDLRKALRNREVNPNHEAFCTIGQYDYMNPPESRVRGANRFGGLLFQEVVDSTAKTEWEPPTVMPRTAQRGGASILTMQQTGLLSDELKTAKLEQRPGWLTGTQNSNSKVAIAR